MIDVPVIETERVVLRGWHNEDFEPYARLMGDAEVTRFLPSGVLSRADAWRHMAMLAGHWTLRSYGVWVLERKSDRAFIGRAGLWNPAGWPALELIWTLDRPYWGNGYATEAACAAMNWGFRSLSLPSMVSHIDPANVASQHVAMRLGQTNIGKTEIIQGQRTLAVDVWEITRECWSRSSRQTE